jgi:hypothetical protein
MSNSALEEKIETIKDNVHIPPRLQIAYNNLSIAERNWNAFTVGVMAVTQENRITKEYDEKVNNIDNARDPIDRRNAVIELECFEEGVKYGSFEPNEDKRILKNKKGEEISNTLSRIVEIHLRKVNILEGGSIIS